MMQRKLSEQQVWDQGQMRLSRLWGAACFAFGLGCLHALGSMRGTAVEALLGKVAKPLAAFFRYDIDAPAVLVAVAIFWIGLGIYFFGSSEELRLKAKAEAERDRKRLQEEQAAADWAVVDEFSRSERACEPGAAPQVLEG